ncbi:hypothetical protein [Microbulbifer epialgicus]|uniref:Uncharacterized protein n=1 Tax=Microbulbifer epialgicus TaxID=393907 RepID=A0ABV4NV38_9GAMM
MADEHRLTFELSYSGELEILALNSVVKKMSISKRSHEYIRRIMVLGLQFKKILNKVNHKIPEIQKAITGKEIHSKSREFKFRLNIEGESNLATTPEEEIWTAISKISKRDQRKQYLRELFLYGYWFESLAERDISVINQLIGGGMPITSANLGDIPNVLAENSAKTKLGGLMPQ